ncbi:MAG: zinc ABC transporter substrate-binding protein [Bacteroidales bacterium]|nr:zinc ABC transporter substrate-binding protein [Bacteroidales bacterium]
MRKIVISLLIVFGLFACNNQQQNHKINKQSVTVSVLPQKYFMERIVGNNLSINVMIPPGASPVTYEPTPKQMKELSVSSLYIRIGHIEFEKSWMKKIRDINPEMRVVDQSVVANLIEPEYKLNDEHEHKGHHHHGVDPHIWTSPKEVKKQIDFLYQYLIKTYPEFDSDFTKNYNSFISEIDSLDSYVTEQLKLYHGNKFMIFHPALSYFARDYGLIQISIEIDGKEPTPANIQEIIEVAKKEEIKVIFVQKQFSTHNAEVIAREINGRVVQIDPLSYNWSESLKLIVDEIVKSYSN